MNIAESYRQLTPPLVHDESELYQNRCALHRFAESLDAPLATSVTEGKPKDKAWLGTANKPKTSSSYCKTHLELLYRTTFDLCC
jgi:hypothetical protein